MLSKKVIVVFLFLIVAFSNFTHAQTLRAYVNAGDNSMDRFRYAEAIEYYKKALEFETDDPSISFKMAEASRKYKDYERAAAWYGKIMVGDRDNSFPLAMFRYAEMKKYLGMYDESCRIYERYATLHANDSDYFAIKVRKEIADCPETNELSKKIAEVEIKTAGTPINTTYSEFGASMMGDTMLYYSSLRFLYEKTKKPDDAYYVARILKSAPKPSKNTQPQPLNVMFNDPPTHNGNAAFSPDYKLMVFSRCDQPDGDYVLSCELFISHVENGKWSKPEKIGADVNLPGYTSTMPAIEARGADGYTLYFVSSRPGGYGNLDIWKSEFNASLQFSNATNLGSVINTFDDEMTPFFDTPNRVLYFSSYGHAGLGGMDIFKSVVTNNEYSKPENLGPGYNTSVNDVYYTLNRDGESGTLSSNRTGSMFIKSKTCCYDIYYFKMLKPDVVMPVVKDTISTPVVITEVDKTDPGTKAYYDDFLPLELYFDNDQPDKKTMAVTTTKTYDKLYKDYMARIAEYKINYAGTLKSEEKTSAENKIDNFFNNVVTLSWNQLNTFCGKVEKALIAGVKIELEVRGRTSPLADNEYNVNLSRRRISSLINYMKLYNSGSLKSYFDDGSLKLTEVPAGETLVKTGVSDQLSDKRNSVYNPDAAIERRIELIDVNLVQPNK
jgi:tetratricopeptide (TPR) repeat protein